MPGAKKYRNGAITAREKQCVALASQIEKSQNAAEKKFAGNIRALVQTAREILPLPGSFADWHRAIERSFATVRKAKWPAKHAAWQPLVEEVNRLFVEVEASMRKELPDVDFEPVPPIAPISVTPPPPPPKPEVTPKAKSVTNPKTKPAAKDKPRKAEKHEEPARPAGKEDVQTPEEGAGAPEDKPEGAPAAEPEDGDSSAAASAGRESDRVLARLMAGAFDAVITASLIRGLPGAITQAGKVWQGNGRYAERKKESDPIPQPIDLGPYEVAAAGSAVVALKGTPPVPFRWTEGNANTSLTVSFAAAVGSTYTSATRLLSLSGQTTSNDLSGKASWDRPGRLYIRVSPPQGSAPLGGVLGCYFTQTWQASLTIEALNAAKPAQIGAALLKGDALQTEIDPAIVVLSSRLIIEPLSLVTFTTRGNTTVVHLKKGGVHYVRAEADGAKRPRGTAIDDGFGHTVEAANEGPVEFIVRRKEESATVYVIAGTVSIGRSRGKPLAVAAGKQCDLPGGDLKPYKHDPDDDYTIDGIPVTAVQIEVPTVAPGSYTPTYRQGRFGDGWIWEDPRRDAQVASPAAGVFKITVPDGNEFWYWESKAPRLLHPVTGDFDLAGELLLSCKSNASAITEFLIYAPGAYLGFHAGQMARDSFAAQYCILGGGWLRMDGLNKLIGYGTRFAAGPDAPRKAVKLLLTRRGDLWRTYWSTDGEHWNLSTRQVLAAPDSLWVGWLFKRHAFDGSNSEPAVNTLSAVTLHTGRPGSLPGPAWDCVQWCGAAEVRGQAVTLSVDRDKPGEVSASVGQRVDGDFEIVVRFAAPPWRHQPGENRSLFIFADAGNDTDYAYIRLRQADETGLRIDTDLRKNGGWGRYRWVEAKGYEGEFRMLRRGATLTTYYRSGGAWLRLDEFDAGFASPVFLGAAIDSAEGASKPTALQAKFTILKLEAQGLAQPSASTPRRLPATPRQTRVESHADH